jgi:hypothetical protein
MVKIIRIVGIAILLFFLVKICTHESPQIDYSTRVKVNWTYPDLYDNSYTFDCTFINTYKYSIDKITAEFVLANKNSKPIVTITKNILPPGYSLHPGAEYKYKLHYSSDEYVYITEVNIIYAN